MQGERNHLKLKKNLSPKDIFTIAFGAMIGWSWVVMSGEWLMRAGTLGAVLAFVFGGIVVYFIGLIYAELTTAIPTAGGEYDFVKRGLGKGWAFLCTWAILLGYVGVVVFESCAFPTVLQYI